MNQGLKTIIYPVKDTEKAKAFFTKLVGSEPYVDSPYYIGYKLGDQEIGLNPNGHAQGMTGPISYYHVDDIKGYIENLKSEGAETLQEPNEVGGGRWIATIKDIDGNVYGLIQDTK